MENKKTLFFMLAFLCYTIPFFFPELCILLFFFPFFLFTLLTRFHLAWYTFGLWSVFTSSVHLLPLWDALLFMAEGPLYLRLLPPFLLILYLTTICTVWLLVTRYFLHTITQSISIKLVIWTFSLWLYVLFIQEGLLFFCPTGGGYIFLSPLLPFAIAPQLLALLPIFHTPGMLLGFCAISSIITFLFLKRSIKTIRSVFLAMFILGGLNVGHQITNQNPDCIMTIGHLSLMLPASTSPVLAQKLVQHELHQLYQAHPHLETVIMPESAWNGTALADIYHMPGINDDIPQVIIGGFAHEGKKTYNRLYCFRNNSLSYTYDKQLTVPLTESPLWPTTKLTTLFFDQTAPLSPSVKPRIPLAIGTIGQCMPYICSDLFCASYQDQCDRPIILLANDWWFRMPHFKKLMVLTARLRAIEWQIPIIYISFHHAQFFDAQGYTSRIATTPANYIR